MLLRWSPRTQLTDLDPLFQAWLAGRNRNLSPVRSNGDAEAPAPWQPPVDVHEDATRILIVADLPGLEQGDVAISIDKNVLSIQGERKPVVAGDGASHRCERRQGPLSRAFTLPPTVDTENISAEMKAGVLTLTLPKRAKAQPRQIKINAA
jgi:HSP20 family protein